MWKKSLVMGIVLALFLLLGIGFALSQARRKPVRKPTPVPEAISKSTLVKALKELRRGDSQDFIVEKIRLRRVNFKLTKMVERELRKAGPGATDELINAVRDNYGGHNIRANRLGMEFVYVPAGSFMMGSPALEVGGFVDESPQHQVTVQSFYMGKNEVTQAQWQTVMGTIPSQFKGCDNCPVEQVSWNDVQEFIHKLDAMDDEYTYRLPTEAEWEYTARAGTTTAFAFGDSLSSRQANFDGYYPYGAAAKRVRRQKTTPVGSFQPNAWGLYDMHGNVWEWCEDIWHSNYDGAPSDGSAWLDASISTARVRRGGSWTNYGNAVRSAIRSWDAPYATTPYTGFRLVAVTR
jgi:formylglycine-generating enzyme required for sulfatase activity